MKELLEMAGVQKSHTTPYHPMGNGIAERFNRTLDGSGLGSVAVGDMDRNVQTMDWLLNAPDIEDPAEENDMDGSLSAAAGSDIPFDDLAGALEVSESDQADADLSLGPAPASVASSPDSVLAVSTPDSVPVSVVPEIAPALVTVTHTPDPD